MRLHAVTKRSTFPALGRLVSMLLVVSAVCTTAQAASSFVDTAQADFEAGTLNAVDTTTSPGDVTLSNAPILDQSNTAGTTTGTGFGISNWTGQTFIPTVSGNLKQAEVQLFANGSGATPPNLTLSVRATSAGLPTGADLATATIPGSTFGDGQTHLVAVTFTSPAAVTAGTKYALVLRPVSVPAGSGYFWIRSSPSTYANGSRVLSADSGSTWSADTTRDFNFKTYIDAGYAPSGTLTSSAKDSNPTAVDVTEWSTLTWTASTPANTALSFQVAASNNAVGPFNFVGPDGTAATFFTTSGASLSQFNGLRYLKYRAYLSSTNTAATPALNDVTLDYAVIPNADLSITKTDGVATVTPGGSVTYTITVSNAGPADVTGATVADTLPAGLTASWTGTGAGGGTGTAAGSGNINDTVNLPAGGSFTYTVTAVLSPSAVGTLSNTATITAPGGVTDPTPGNNSATDTDSLTPSADLAITKTDGVTTVTPGGSVTYTITASNAGPSDAIGATVADTLPASLTGVTWTAVGAGGGTATASGSGNINDTVNLPAGGSVTYTVTASISGSATGTLSNTATITAPAGVPDSNPANDSATDTDTLAASADLSITKTDGVTTATHGGNVTYTITVSNAGPSNVIGATVADTLPAAITSATWTSVGAGGGAGTASGSGNINDTVNLPAGGSLTYTVVAAISATAAGMLTNTATVTAPSGVADPNPANNSATDSDALINAAPVFSSAPTATPNPAGVDESVQFTASATDADGDAISYLWDFGDGTTGAGSSVTHAYAAAGAFTVSVTATDTIGAATTSSTVTVTVSAPLSPPSPPQPPTTPPAGDLNNDGQMSPMDADSDGDGFPDNIEIALGSNAKSSSSTPTGATAGAFQTFRMTNTKVTLPSGRPERITFKGVLHIDANLAIAGQKIAIDAGGNTRAFQLDSRGRGETTGARFSLRTHTTSSRAREVGFSLVIDGELLKTLIQNSPRDAEGRPTMLSVNICFNGTLLNAVRDLSYRE